MRACFLLAVLLHACAGGQQSGESAAIPAQANITATLQSADGSSSRFHFLGEFAIAGSERPFSGALFIMEEPCNAFISGLNLSAFPPSLVGVVRNGAPCTLEQIAETGSALNLTGLFVHVPSSTGLNATLSLHVVVVNERTVADMLDLAVLNASVEVEVIPKQKTRQSLGISDHAIIGLVVFLVVLCALVIFAKRLRALCIRITQNRDRKKRLLAPKLATFREVQSARKVKTKHCTLCTSKFTKDAEVRTLRCNHVFHRSCVDLWVSKVGSCPVCKEASTSPIQGVLVAMSPDSETALSTEENETSSASVSVPINTPSVQPQRTTGEINVSVV